MKAWTRFIKEASKGLPRNKKKKKAERIISNSTSSIQGIFPAFQKSPSVVWLIEECASQVKILTDSNMSTNVQRQMRDKCNELYECGERGKPFSSPLSQEGNKFGFKPINNLIVSEFWTTTLDQLNIPDSAALSGLLSRYVVIRHKGRGGKLRELSG